MASSDELQRFAIEVEAVASILDTLDYFQVLKIGPQADAAEVRAAFHRESRRFHPDRVYHLQDAALKANVHRIYKRVTEAYATLRDDERRRKYAADVSGPDRARKLRYTEESEAERKRAREEEIGTTPNGRRFYLAGVAALEAGAIADALRNLKAALVYEPQNPRYREKAAEAQALANRNPAG